MMRALARAPRTTRLHACMCSTFAGPDHLTIGCRVFLPGMRRIRRLCVRSKCLHGVCMHAHIQQKKQPYGTRSDKSHKFVACLVTASSPTWSCPNIVWRLGHCPAHLQTGPRTRIRQPTCGRCHTFTTSLISWQARTWL
jgi:hypothetical protein